MTRDVQKDLDVVRDYHQRTKHHLDRYAAGPATLDWTEQPDPFRTFSGTPERDLPLNANRGQTGYDDLFSPRRIAPSAITLDNIGTLFELSFGLSARKAFGDDRWALRCNPSSGNLHPTEAYLVATNVTDLPAGVYHYCSYRHALEQRCTFSQHGEGKGFLVGLSSIHWRESWKYGERAFRYSQLDVGHAIAALAFAAATLGWSVRLLTNWSTTEIASVLGTSHQGDFGNAEAEYPEAMLFVTTERAHPPFPGTLIAMAEQGRWQGQANVLDRRHRYDWPVIDAVADATATPGHNPPKWQAPTRPALVGEPTPLKAAQVIMQRRSAQAFDGRSSLPAPVFYRMLDRTLPRPGVVPWSTLPWPPRIHLILFVHHVEGLQTGLYALPRHGDIDLRSAMREQFEWQAVDGCPAHLPLTRLIAANARRAAGTLSCHQAIAADSAFSLAMLAEFDAPLASAPWAYRNLYWEAGMLGQVLYLEAEAAGFRGTGIGCFFDDAVHETLGITDTRLQNLYHFTVGTPLTDARLQTLPPYGHLKR